VDLTRQVAAFAAEVGADGPVTVTGLGTRGGPVAGVRVVRAPVGIEWIQADEMTVSCGAGTPVDELAAALAEVGQRVALPPGGTVGGALAVGRSGTRRLGDGPVRDTLLQTDFVSASGDVVRAGGPTVKNVSGFDLCRLLVGSRGTLGFLGAVILRTRPIPAASRWGRVESIQPFAVFGRLHRPVSVLWDGATVWALVEGHAADVEEQFVAAALTEVAGPPSLPSGGRELVAPAAVSSLTGAYVAEVGVGVVHRHEPVVATQSSNGVEALSARVKAGFDPIGRLNPGVIV
jgi:hypothetical protein